MKKILLSFIAIFALLLLANCTAQNCAPENTKREWMLIEFQDFSKEMMVANKANLNLTTQNESDRFTAKMGCNSMFGQAKFTSENKVNFSQLGSTMMYCDKNMALESAFVKDLVKITDYKIEGHFLTLSVGNKKIMKFVAADWD